MLRVAVAIKSAVTQEVTGSTCGDGFQTASWVHTVEASLERWGVNEQGSWEAWRSGGCSLRALERRAANSQVGAETERNVSFFQPTPSHPDTHRFSTSIPRRMRGAESQLTESGYQ